MEETAELLTTHSFGVPQAHRTPESASMSRAEFVTLFERTFERMRRYLDRLSGDPDLASELAQDAYVHLYRGGSVPRDPDAWLFTVATNLFRNSRSRRWRRSRLLTAQRSHDVLSDPPASLSEGTESLDAGGRVREALAWLHERDRALLLLRAEGQSHREIAATLQIAEGSVGTLLRRAKERFLTPLQEVVDAL